MGILDNILGGGAEDGGGGLLGGGGGGGGGLLADPTNRMMLGAQFLSNGAPSLTPKSGFEGIPQMMAQQQRLGMLKQQQKRADDERALALERQRKQQAWVMENMPGMAGAPVGIQSAFYANTLAGPAKQPNSAQQFPYSQQNPEFAEHPATRSAAEASGTTVQFGEDKNAGKAGDYLAGMFGELAQDGIKAKTDLALTNRLAGYFREFENGAGARFKQLAGEFGIKPEGLDEMQAATAIINKMVPAQRVAGSGSLSGADLSLFRQSLPRIMSQPGGNAHIIETLRGLAEYRRQQGEIAQLALTGNGSREQALEALSKLENPLAEFNAALGDSATGPAANIDGPIKPENETVEHVRAAPRTEGSAPSSWEGFAHDAGDFMSRASDAVTFEWGPKYRAGLKAVLPEAIGGTGKGYEENLEAEVARKQRVIHEKPWLNVGAETVGIGTQALTGMGLARFLGFAPAATPVGRVAQTTGTGATTGGVTFAGEAKTGEEADAALDGIVVGGGLSLVGGSVLEGAGKVISSIGKKAEERAARRIAKKMIDDGVTPDAARTEIREAKAAGAEDYALIDAGKENTKRLGRTMVNLGGDPADTMANFVDTRVAGQHDRFSSAVEKHIGRKVPVDEVGTALENAASKRADSIHENMSDVVVLPTEMKQRIYLSGASAEAFKRGREIASETGDVLDPLFINGKFNPEIKKVGAKTLYYLREGLDSIIAGETTSSPNGKQVVSKLGSVVSRTRDAVDGLLNKTSRGVRRTNKIYSDFSDYQQALIGGGKYNTLRPVLLQDLIKTMSPKARAMYRLGAVFDMHTKLLDMKNAGKDITKGFLASRDDLARLETLFGGKRGVKVFLEFAKAEKTMARTNRRLAVNSSKAHQADDMADFTGEKIANVVRHGGLKSFRNFAANVIEGGLGVTDAERNAIADILTTIDDETLTGAFRSIAEHTRKIQQSAPAFLAGDLAAGLAAGDAAREQMRR